MMFGANHGIYGGLYSSNPVVEPSFPSTGVNGYTAGLVISYPFRENLSMRLQPCISTRGVDLVFFTTSQYRFTYFDIPVNIVKPFSIPEIPFDTYFIGGFSVGYLIKAEGVFEDLEIDINGDEYIEINTKDISNDYKDFDLSYDLGVGVNYTVFAHKVFTDIIYNHGLLDRESVEDSGWDLSWKTKGWKIQFGFYI